jgi:hypothetical protein
MYKKIVIPHGLKFSTSSISRKFWSACENQNMFGSKCSFWHWMCEDATKKYLGASEWGQKEGWLVLELWEQLAHVGRPNPLFRIG